MATATIVYNPTDDLIERFSQGVDKSDVKAWFENWGMEITENIKSQFKTASMAFMGLVNGEPAVVVCILDVEGSFLEKNGYIWLLMNDVARTAPKAVIRESLYHIKRIMEVYPRLTAGIDVSVKKNERYAEFLGFKATGRTESFNGKTYSIYIKEKE